ncbi:DUF1800 domain-containing protein [Grimontia hollisae]|uniref:DUF1800 domain-containing protein n=1 Tax=Grimontia hollisae CIP 101886 TaxID=675812 RepID=D0IB01_GRIHO|nr:DUF1800 domain-containing protein [Grimontia hollisae]EEY71069.1 hypothetical protein VHA_002928 [Grimontia hollisae CIP 101886]
MNILIYVSGDLNKRQIHISEYQNYPDKLRVFDMQFDSFSHASRWLDLATFGPKKGEVENLINKGAKTWFDEQIALPVSSHLKQCYQQFEVQGYGKKPSRSTRIRAWLDIAFYSKDQLRQRVAYALSQIFVVSDQDAALSYRAPAMASYNDMLCQHAFGHYRDLLKEVSLSAVMGQYLTMVGNRKGDPATGRRPDENYAREIMQLFSVGLYQRDIDGTYELDGNGQPIPCYTEKDIQELARVFTGWHHTDNTFLQPMVNHATDHDSGEKWVMGHQFPENMSAEQELDQVMDMLLHHPSTAPNICHGLIQRLVTSNPSPDYVRRVTEAFLDNGMGVTGDLKAVIWAILSDPDVYTAPPQSMSKIREPWLSLVCLYRALNVKPGAGSRVVKTDLVYLKTCNQYPLGAPSVFNFYLPDYAPKGVIKENNLVAPELQIIDWSHIIYVHNFIYGILRLNLQKITAPLSNELYIDVEDFKTLIANKDIKGFVQETSERFFNGAMPKVLKESLYRQYNGLNLAPGKWVQRLLFIALVSPYFHVQENRV